MSESCESSQTNWTGSRKFKQGKVTFRLLGIMIKGEVLLTQIKYHPPYVIVIIYDVMLARNLKAWGFYD